MRYALFHIALAAAWLAMAPAVAGTPNVGVCSAVVGLICCGNEPPRLAEIARDAKKYVEAKRAQMLRRSEELNRILAMGTVKGKPHVVDVLAIGAGPHSGVFMANLKMVRPELKTLVVDASDGRFGTFDGVRGFKVNTKESPEKSGNTFPGVPIQPRDLNIHNEEYVDAQNFGDVTVLAHEYAGGEVAFNNRVVKVTENPADKKDTSGYRGGARYRVEMENGVVVMANTIFNATGLGEPKAAVPHEESQKLIDREVGKFRLTRSDPRFGPKIQVVDTFLRLQEEDVSAGRDPLARYEGGTIAVIGAGDGGNIAVEGALRLTRSLNPKELPAANQVVWIGQKGTDAETFIENLPVARRKRYGDIQKGYGTAEKNYEDKVLTSMPGHLAQIREIDMPGGRVRYELTYVQMGPDKKPIPGSEKTVIADHVVFATGYENKALLPFQGLAKPGENLSMEITHADTTDFTATPGLQGQAPVAEQITVGGKPHAIYVGGQAAAASPGDPRFAPTDKDWSFAFGGWLDVLLQRSAALGREVAPTVKMSRFSPRVIRTELKGKDYISLFYEKLPPPGLKLWDNLTGTTLALREESAKRLSSFAFPTYRPVEIVLRRAKLENEYVIEVMGVDEAGAAELKRVFSGLGAEDIQRLLRDYFSYGGQTITVRVNARSDGSISFESMQMGMGREP